MSSWSRSFRHGNLSGYLPLNAIPPPTWWIIPVSKLGSPLFISHEVRPFVRGTTPVRGLKITMVANYLLNGMILQEEIRPYYKGLYSPPSGPLGLITWQKVVLWWGGISLDSHGNLSSLGGDPSGKNEVHVFFFEANVFPIWAH